MTNFNRRNFLSTTGLASLGTLAALGNTRTLRAEEATLAGRFYKTLKIGMIKEGDTLKEKFQMAKEAGFQGVELNAPGFDIDEVNAAIAETGLPVDGSVCAEHWNIRHSDPDESVRAKALEYLLGALRETKAVGGHTVLLVVGHGKDGPEEEIWPRIVANMQKALPLASELGVAIAVENVWNQFCYDHDGDSNQSAEKFVRFIDEFDSPWVGMQFDIGNHWKYGNTGDWIRQLGKRIIKLDVKGFSREQDKFTDIGEGDLDFPDVCKALREIDYHGWCAAEVGGGNLERLKLVSSQMDKAFELG